MHRYFEAHRAMLDGAVEGGDAQRILERRSRGPQRQDLRRDGEGRRGAPRSRHRLGKPFEMDHPGSERLGKEEIARGAPARRQLSVCFHR